MRPITYIFAGNDFKTGLMTTKRITSKSLKIAVDKVVLILDNPRLLRTES